MKKALALGVAVIICFSGCSKKNEGAASSILDPPPERQSSSSQESRRDEKPAHDLKTPGGTAMALLDRISNINREEMEALVKQYMAIDTVPESYYKILRQIADRLSFKTGNTRINGGKAEVDVTVTSIDAQKALESEIPGALAHLAALQIAGKDADSPEKILADYAADNIEWEKLTTIKTETVMYLVKDSNGEWQVDMNHPGNLDFANAVSGGALKLAGSLKSYADRFSGNATA